MAETEGYMVIVPLAVGLAVVATLTDLRTVASVIGQLPGAMLDAVRGPAHSFAHLVAALWG